jgi:hypothetical protein
MGAQTASCRERLGLARFLAGAVTVGAMMGLTVCAPARADSPLMWSVPSQVAPTALNAVSCPTVALCVAVDNSGNVATTADPTGTGAWAIANVDTHGLTAVSCPTVTFCAAVDNAGSVVTSTNPTGGSGAWALANVAGSAFLQGLSCPTAAVCVASDHSGDVVTSTNPTGGAGAWTIAHVPFFANAMSCPTAGLCVGVGFFGTVVTSTNPTGGAGAWTAVDADDANILDGVACATATLCVATDLSGNALTSANPTGGAGAWTPAHIGANVGLGAVACPTPAMCMTLIANGVLTSTNPTGGTSTWTFSTADTQPNNLTGVSCPTDRFCVVVDDQGKAAVGQSSASHPPDDGAGQDDGGDGASSDGSGAAVEPPRPAAISARALLAALRAGLVPRPAVAKIASLLKFRSITLTFHTLEAGTLKVGWYQIPAAVHATRAHGHKRKPVLVASGNVHAAGAGTAKVKLKLTAAGKTLLKHAEHVKLTAKGAFTPVGRRATIADKTFILGR